MRNESIKSPIETVRRVLREEEGKVVFEVVRSSGYRVGKSRKDSHHQQQLLYDGDESWIKNSRNNSHHHHKNSRVAKVFPPDTDWRSGEL